MPKTFLPDTLHAYLMDATLREPEVLGKLRDETAALPNAGMQIAPDQGQFMAFLARLTGAKRYLEIGVFTGYSSTCMALAMPDDARIVACDVSEEFTSVARRYWEAAGVAHKMTLRLGPALETLAELEAAGEPFDLAFIDADKPNTPAYFESCLRLVRPGGVVMVDNVLWDGRVADPAANDPDTSMFRDLTYRHRDDPRVDFVLLPIGDGLTLCRRL